MNARGAARPGDADPPDRSINFDHFLPMMHTYLGQNLEEIPGRTVLDDWSFHTVPLHAIRGLILVPGQTLPLNEYLPKTIRMLEQCIQTDHLFGSIGVLSKSNSNHSRLADVGTIAEIYECRSVNNGNALCVKAIGRQRFRLIKTKEDSNGCKGTVQILPEIILPDPMSEIRLNTLNRFRCNLDDEKSRSIFRREAVTSQWPGWVFSQFRLSTLVGRVKKLLDDFDLGPEFEKTMPKDPVALSYWLVRAIPIGDEERVAALRFNSAIMRLQYILKRQKKCTTLCCSVCHTPVAKQWNIFSMSVEGALGAYVNPNGYIHEIITVTQSKSIVTRGAAPTTEFSWFPGYAWRIAQCEMCSEHLGWRFTSVKPQLKPASFWGLARRSIESRNITVDDEDELV